MLDLTQKDFRVFDNGVEQTINHWEMGGDPLAVALVIETSSHISMMAPVIHGMGSIFTETVMALSGKATVITYDSTVEVRQPFTPIMTTCRRDRASEIRSAGDAVVRWDGRGGGAVENTAELIIGG